MKSRLHKGWKATAYNGVFVGAFNAMPRPLVRRFGWHLMADVRESRSGLGVRDSGLACGAELQLRLTRAGRYRAATTDL